MSFPSPQVIHIDSLEEALIKLGIQVSVNDLLKTIHEVEKAKRNERLKNFPPASPVEITRAPVGKVVWPDPNAPPDPERTERRRRLLQLTREAFPDGKVPAPALFPMDSGGPAF